MNSYTINKTIELTDGTRLEYYEARDTHGSVAKSYTHFDGNVQLDFFNTTHTLCHGIRRLLKLRKDKQ